MKLILISILVVFSSFTFAQKVEIYQKNVEKAKEASKQGDFKKAVKYYKYAFDKTNIYTQYDMYDAACCFALIEESDSAFNYLFFISEKGLENYSNFEQLEKDSDFTNMHSDQKWDSLVTIVKNNYRFNYENINQELMEELSIVYQNDQEDRQVYSEYFRAYGTENKLVKELKENIRVKDSINQIIVCNILDEHGWLGPEIVSYEGNIALFLVIQHSPLEIQIKYLPMMREAVANQRAYPVDLALLEDRVALRQGQKQIYGSQVVFDEETEHYYLEPTIEPEKLDDRRVSVGLMGIVEYYAIWGEKWDLEMQKKFWERKELEKKP